MVPTVRKSLVTAALAALVAPPLFAGPPKPVGTWARDAAPLKVSVTFSETTITARATFDEGDGADTITLDAEYSVTSDGVLYGVITGVDARPLELAADLQAIAGQPFAARCRVDGGIMSLREVKFLGAGLPSGGSKKTYDDIVAAVAGRYEASEPTTKPAAKAAPVVAPRMLPPPATVSDLPAAIVAQWEKDTGVRRSGGDVRPSPGPVVPAGTWHGQVMPRPVSRYEYHPPTYFRAVSEAPMRRSLDVLRAPEVAPAPRPCGTH